MGERWLEEATATYRGGGSHVTAGTQACLGVGYLLIAVLDALPAPPAGGHELSDRAAVAIAQEYVDSLCRPPRAELPCVCGEPNTPGTHRVTGPCVVEQ